MIKNVRVYHIQLMIDTWKILRKINPEIPILLSPGAMQAGLSHLGIALLLRRKIAVYVPMAHSSIVLRASWANARDWLTAFICRHVKLWITVSKTQSELLKKNWNISNALVIPNRIIEGPSTLFRAQSPLLRLLFLGRFDSSQKGLDWMIEVFKNNRIKHISLAFQGRGPYQEALEAFALIDVGFSIIIKPWGDPKSAFSDADILILPSRFEGFPLVAIEAIYAGVAVVATKESGLDGVLPGQCQFVFGDEHGFIAAIERLREPKERLACISFARQKLSNVISQDYYEKGIGEFVNKIHELINS
jgi:glycosyltransferase involved in cell wall biosynthesis